MTAGVNEINLQKLALSKVTLRLKLWFNLCQLVFSVGGLKIFSLLIFAMKYPNKISTWWLDN